MIKPTSTKDTRVKKESFLAKIVSRTINRGEDDDLLRIKQLKLKYAKIYFSSLFYLLILYICSILLVIATEILLHDPHPRNVNYAYKQPFHMATGFCLVASIPLAIDLIVEYRVQQDFEKEYMRPCFLIIVSLPAVLMYGGVFSHRTISMVIYCQQACLLMLLATKTTSFVIFQDMNHKSPLRRLCVISIISLVLGFLYHIADNKYSSWNPTLLKALFTIFTSLSHAGLLIRTFQLLKIFYVYYFTGIREVDRKRYLYGIHFFMTIMAGLPLILYLILYNHNQIFFPTSMIGNVVMESYMIAYLVVILSMTSYEYRDEILHLKTSLESNRKLTRSISHEIRTPLNTAFMGLELLQDSLKYPNKKEAEVVRIRNWLETADNVHEACDIALSILNQLLTFDKLSAGMLQIEKKLTPVLHIIDINSKLFKMQAVQANIQFRVDMNKDEQLLYRELLFFVDEHKINQVIRNLLSNAMKFTPKRGSVTIQTRIDLQYYKRKSIDHKTTPPTNPLSCFPRKTRIYNKYFLNQSKAAAQSSSQNVNVDGCKIIGMMRISVIDSGPGISKEDQSKLFQDYVQINPGELQKGQGSGLGLSISKSIISMHGGNVGVSSEGKDKGSTFYIELPVYRRRIVSSDNLQADDIEANKEDGDQMHRASVKYASDPQEDKELIQESRTIPPLPTFETKRPIETEPSSVTIVQAFLNSPDCSKVEYSGTFNDSPQATTRRTVHRIEKRLHFLVCDDSVANRKMLTRLLKRDGHASIEAGDGSDAVQIIQEYLAEQLSGCGLEKEDKTMENSFTSDTEPSDIYEKKRKIDVIILDNYMNNMNGMDAARVIRNLGFHNPIIGVSGVLDDVAEEFVQAGADIVLRKPINMISLNNALKSINFLK